MGSKRVLIVDDSRSARHVLKRQLKQQGLTVDEVESAEDALQYLLYNRPHAIFMDHMMPGMDGLQAVRIIKGNPATDLIPIVMFTSKEGGEIYLAQARALGAAGVLPKQIDSSDLESVLDSLHLLEEPEATALVVAEEPGGPANGDAIETQADNGAQIAPNLDHASYPTNTPEIAALKRQAADDELIALLKPLFEAQARRMQSSFRSEVRHLVEKIQSDRRRGRQRQWPALAAGVVLGILLTSGVYSLLPARAQPGPAAATVNIDDEIEIRLLQVATP